MPRRQMHGSASKVGGAEENPQHATGTQENMESGTPPNHIPRGAMRNLAGHQMGKPPLAKPVGMPHALRR